MAGYIVVIQEMFLCFRKYTPEHIVILRHLVYKLSNYTRVCVRERERKRKKRERRWIIYNLGIIFWKFGWKVCWSSLYYSCNFSPSLFQNKNVNFKKETSTRSTQSQYEKRRKYIFLKGTHRVSWTKNFRKMLVFPSKSFWQFWAENFQSASYSIPLA